MSDKNTDLFSGISGSEAKDLSKKDLFKSNFISLGMYFDYKGDSEFLRLPLPLYYDFQPNLYNKFSSSLSYTPKISYYISSRGLTPIISSPQYITSATP